MATYYAKRALDILQEEGLIELFQRCKKVLGYYTRRPLLELQKIKLKLKYGGSAPSPYNLIYVSPSDITHCCKIRHIIVDEHFLNISKSNARYGTFIIGGGWDREPEEDGYDDHRYKTKFENYYMWESTVEHFEKGIAWENTSGFNKTHKGVEWFQPIKELYDIIHSDGYKTQRELEDNYDEYFMPSEYDEIRVSIGRDGEIFFDDGRHRFCALKILDIDTKIPVRVVVRHKQWQELRDEIHNNGLPEGREGLRDHPDLQDILDGSYRTQ